MTGVNTENIIGSTKRQVAVSDIKAWPEVAHTVRVREPLWAKLLIVLLSGAALAIGYAVGMYVNGQPVPAEVNWTFSGLACVLGAAAVLLLIRILLRKGQYTLRENAAILQGMGDVCVLKGVRKVRRLMHVPEQLRELYVIAIEGGFEKQKHLGRLWLPNCTERVADGLFRGCRNLTCIHLPERLKAVPPSLMEKCSRLQAVVIPVCAESIGARAFAGCKRLRDVYIAAAVTEIAEDAFSGCRKMLFHVQEASAAEQYARRHNINYTYH